MIILKTKGTYYSEGEIVLNPLKTLHWKDLSDQSPAHLPNGSIIELSISFDEDNFLSGKDGVVWATYDLRQAEIIQSTLLVQHINSEIKQIIIEDVKIYIIVISDQMETGVAADFIWKSDYGLRLKPDWNYSEDGINKSFEQWLSGH